MVWRACCAYYGLPPCRSPHGDVPSDTESITHEVANKVGTPQRANGVQAIAASVGDLERGGVDIREDRVRVGVTVGQPVPCRLPRPPVERPPIVDEAQVRAAADQHAHLVHRHRLRLPGARRELAEASGADRDQARLRPRLVAWICRPAQHQRRQRRILRVHAPASAKLGCNLRLCSFTAETVVQLHFSVRHGVPEKARDVICCGHAGPNHKNSPNSILVTQCFWDLPSSVRHKRGILPRYTKHLRPRVGTGGEHHGVRVEVP
mmetsp:Transcript_117106/g.326247  ORF Transcript_117106/g.326247 Transcript_117106/m.326247 type:complete len:263 (-) Transcript_117106:428-1216(-)